MSLFQHEVWWKQTHWQTILESYHFYVFIVASVMQKMSVRSNYLVIHNKKCLCMMHALQLATLVSNTFSSCVKVCNVNAFKEWLSYIYLIEGGKKKKEWLCSLCRLTSLLRQGGLSWVSIASHINTTDSKKHLGTNRSLYHSSSRRGSFKVGGRGLGQGRKTFWAAQ